MSELRCRNCLFIFLVDLKNIYSNKKTYISR